MNEVNIIVIAYNEEKYIADCINAILKQSIPDFKLIVVDDGSTDKTSEIIKGIPDSRIVYLRNEKRKGFSTARNEGLKMVKRGFVFFTDADCIPEDNWLEEGIKSFNKKGVISVSGMTKYTSPFCFLGGKPLNSEEGKDYIPVGTDNIAYRFEVLNMIGGFRSRYNDGWEDLDVSLRAREKGELCYSNRMIVNHVKKQQNLKRRLMWLKRVKQYVYLIKDHHAQLDEEFKNFKKIRNSHESKKGTSFCRKIDILRKNPFYMKIGPLRVVFPFYFLIIIFPPFLYFILKEKNIPIKSFKTIVYTFLIYGYFVMMRIIIWSTAIKEGFFVI